MSDYGKKKNSIDDEYFTVFKDTIKSVHRNIIGIYSSSLEILNTMPDLDITGYYINDLICYSASYKANNNIIKSIVLHEFVHACQLKNRHQHNYYIKHQQNVIPYKLETIENEAYAIQLLYLIKNGLLNKLDSSILDLYNDFLSANPVLENLDLTLIKNERKFILSVVDLFGPNDTRKIYDALKKCQNFKCGSAFGTCVSE
jgi:hypothetical protein